MCSRYLRALCRCITRLQRLRLIRRCTGARRTIRISRAGSSTPSISTISNISTHRSISTRISTTTKIKTPTRRISGIRTPTTPIRTITRTRRPSIRAISMAMGNTQHSRTIITIPTSTKTSIPIKTQDTVDTDTRASHRTNMATMTTGTAIKTTTTAIRGSTGISWAKRFSAPSGDDAE